jgi:hypothetical protein
MACRAASGSASTSTDDRGVTTDKTQHREDHQDDDKDDGAKKDPLACSHRFHMHLRAGVSWTPRNLAVPSTSNRSIRWITTTLRQPRCPKPRPALSFGRGDRPPSPGQQYMVSDDTRPPYVSQINVNVGPRARSGRGRAVPSERRSSSTRRFAFRRGRRHPGTWDS